MTRDSDFKAYNNSKHMKSGSSSIERINTTNRSSVLSNPQIPVATKNNNGNQITGSNIKVIP